MSKIDIFGDLHLSTKTKIHEKACYNMIEYICKLPSNKTGNYAIFLGDITDKAVVDSDVTTQMLCLFKQLYYDKVYIVHGNHTYYFDKERRTDISTISFLTAISAIPQIIILDKKPQEFNIENIRFLALPHLKPSFIEGKRMKDYYDRLPPEIVNKEYNYIVGHIADKTNTCFGHYSDISYLSGVPILGHIHIANGNSLGSMRITKYSEKNKDSFYGQIDTETKKYTKTKVPVFLDYKEIDYNYEGSFEDNIIYDIKNAPSIKSAEEKFSDIEIREVYEVQYSKLRDKIEGENASALSVEELKERCLSEYEYEEETKELIKEVS